MIFLSFSFFVLFIEVFIYLFFLFCLYPLFVIMVFHLFNLYTYNDLLWQLPSKLGSSVTWQVITTLVHYLQVSLLKVFSIADEILK